MVNLSKLKTGDLVRCDYGPTSFGRFILIGRLLKNPRGLYIRYHRRDTSGVVTHGIHTTALIMYADRVKKLGS